MTKLTDTQYARVRDAILNELWHFAEDAGDPDMYADAIMAMLEKELGE